MFLASHPKIRYCWQGVLLWVRSVSLDRNNDASFWDELHSDRRLRYPEVQGINVEKVWAHPASTG